MKPQPKPKRELDPKYLDFIDKLPCVVHGPDCSYGEGRSTHHHLQQKGHGAKASKCSDRRAIPMCAKHHEIIHRTGRETFLNTHGLDPEAIITNLNSIWERICRHMT